MKIIMILAMLGAAVWGGYNIIPVYNTYGKVNNVFKNVSDKLPTKSEDEIRAKLPDLMGLQYLLRTDVPDEFYDNLVIKANGTHVDISSSYHVTVWLLGEPETIDPDSDYTESDVKGMDKLRLKMRMNFDFEPHSSNGDN